MKFNHQIKNAGYFQLFKKQGESLSPLTDVFKNLITDAFLTWLDGREFVFLDSGTEIPNARCAVGTSSTTPTVSDSALGSLVGYNASVVRSTSVTYDVDLDEVVCTSVVTFTFNQGAIVANISEVGVYYGNPSNSMLLKSRSLIKDSNGDPTAITLTADDQLVVVYTDINSFGRTIEKSFTYNSVNYNIVGKFCGTSNMNTVAARGHSHNLALGAIRNPNNTARVCENSYTFPAVTANTFGANPSAYTPTSLTPANPTSGRKSKVRVPLATGNYASGFTGLSFIVYGTTITPFSSDPQWQFQVTPKVPKTNQFVFDLEFYHKNVRA